jgi:hypothetical protein
LNLTYYTDADGDGQGSGNAQILCAVPTSGYATAGGDCNDANAAINSTATEVCGNAIDENCDGVDGTLSLADISNFNASIYPNPSNGTFVVRFNTTVNDGILDLTDINGKRVLSKQITSLLYEINDLTLKKGIYFLTITSSIGITSQRVIIN